MQSARFILDLKTGWSKENSVSQRVACRYSECRSIQKIGVGAFSIPHAELSWLDAIRAMQQERQLPIPVGARTALELYGAAHNIAPADGTLHSEP